MGIMANTQKQLLDDEEIGEHTQKAEQWDDVLACGTGIEV